MEDIFPHTVPIAGDGFGNFWILDLVPGETEWGPVLFACHDAPVIVHQADSLKQFIAQLREFTVSAPQSAINLVHEDYQNNIWRNNPNTIPVSDARAGHDAGMREFAQSLEGDDWYLIDLRHAKIGDGFSWGRYGPRTVVKRHGSARLFAVQVRKSLWQRLFGKK